MSLRNTTIILLCLALIAKKLHYKTDGKECKRLINARINDWDGVSLVTKDYINSKVSFLAILNFQ